MSAQRPRRAAAFRAAACWLLLGLLGNVAPVAADDGPAKHTQPAKLSDPALLALEGTWEGTCKMGNQAGAGPAEIVWKQVLGGQWVEATLHAWGDMAKKSMFFDARMYIRPTATPGMYKVYAVDNAGVGQTGEIMIKDGTWHWTFAYDNGNKEEGTMNDPAKGKVTYKGTVTDPGGQEIMYVGFDLKKTKAAYSTR